MIANALLVFLPITLFAQPHEGVKGDVNNDGSINVLDILSIANHILGIVILDEQGLWRADCNGSEGSCDGEGVINILDALKIVNIILGSDGCSGTTVTDIDGNVYKVVTIGDQIWMAENLKTTKFSDGEPIPNVTDNSEWCSRVTPAYCWYNNNSSNRDTLGGLYNWYAVNTGKLAPTGWHIPSEAEWNILISYLGGETVAGSRLADIGFRAQGAGQRTSDFGIFNLSPDLDKYWTITQGGWEPTDVKYCVLTRIAPSISWSSHPKSAGHSVRCVKD
ncbi:MAG: hypothetical protein JSV84_16660 [Gemmatimonadota bacterium]|nr:MAG: hypothetical protein JSV84_16660 [Gemmatimonadota bacterium]